MDNKTNIYNAIQNLYNMDKTTWQEVLAELYNLVNNVNQKFEDVETKFLTNLGEETTFAIKTMYDNGMLGQLINGTLLKDINDKVDEVEADILMTLTDYMGENNKKVETINEQLDNIVHKSNYFVTLEMFGGEGNGKLTKEKDTTAWKMALEVIKNSNGKISTLKLQNGQYWITEPSTIDFPLSIEGVFAQQDLGMGSVIFDATDSNSQTPFIEIINDGISARGIVWRNFVIRSFTSEEKKMKHDAVVFSKMGWEMHIENVLIYSFLGSGLVLDRQFDTTIKGLTIYKCGGVINGTPHYALELKTSTNDVTNAIHIFGLHIEGTQHMLNCEEFRHCEFIGCKFEENLLSSEIDLMNPLIKIKSKFENNFIGCSFILQSIEQWITKLGSIISMEEIPYRINIRSDSSSSFNNNFTSFSNCKFTVANNGVQRIIYSDDNANVNISGSHFNYIGGSDYGIKLGNRTNFINNSVLLNCTSITDKAIYTNGSIAENRFRSTNLKTDNPIIMLGSNGKGYSHSNTFEGCKCYIGTESVANKIKRENDNFTIITEEIMQSLYPGYDPNNVIIDMKNHYSNFLVFGLSQPITIKGFENTVSSEEIMIFNNSSNVISLNGFINHSSTPNVTLSGNDICTLKNMGWNWLIKDTKIFKNN